MGIRFNYLYRDASNYKSWASVVFSEPNLDRVDVDQCTDELRSLFLDCTFSAHQIAVPEVFTFIQGKAGPDDHCLHEFASVELTNEMPSDILGRSFFQFLEQVRTASMGGWEGFDPTTPSRVDRAFRFSR